MKNLKCGIEVSFFIEEDLSRFSDKDKEDFADNKDLMKGLFEQDLLDMLKYFSSNIRDLKTEIVFIGGTEECQ